jgi:hypothetical protein
MNLFEHQLERLKTEHEKTLAQKIDALNLLKADLESQPAPDFKMTVTAVNGTSESSIVTPGTTNPPFKLGHVFDAAKESGAANKLSIATMVMGILNASRGTQRANFSTLELVKAIKAEKIPGTTKPTAGNVSVALSKLKQDGEVIHNTTDASWKAA